MQNQPQNCAIQIGYVGCCTAHSISETLLVNTDEQSVVTISNNSCRYFHTVDIHVAHFHIRMYGSIVVIVQV